MGFPAMNRNTPIGCIYKGSARLSKEPQILRSYMNAQQEYVAPYLYIYIDFNRYYMPYHDVVNLVTVTKMNMIAETPCSYGNLRITAVTIQDHVSCRAVQRSQLLMMSSEDLCRGLSCSKIGLSCKTNIGASSMHIHNHRCFQENLRILL